MTLERIKIQEQYGNLSRVELTALLKHTLEQRDSPIDPTWQAWLVKFCIQTLRPHTAAAKPNEWCRWLAFLVRYIEPLTRDNPPLPYEMKAVEKSLKHRPKTMQVLMFGAYEAALDALKHAYELQAEDKLPLQMPELSPEQQTKLNEELRYIAEASPKTVNEATRYYLDELGDKTSLLAGKVFASFHSTSPYSLADLLGVVDALFHRTEKRDGYTYREQFETYLARATEQPLSNGVAALALYLLMDFERRQNLVLNFATAVKYLGVVLLAALGLFGVVTLFPSSLPRDIVGIVSLVLAALSFLMMLIFLGLLILFSYVDHYWIQTALNMLAAVQGDSD